MFNNPHIPVFFEIDEIENHLNSLSSAKLKLDYLKELYFEYTTLCYYFHDRQIENYLKATNLFTKYLPIPYRPNSDKYQTHISRSKFIKFLRKIDDTLLPYVRKEIKKYDKSFKEDQSKIIKDNPVFNFNQEKILEYCKSLKKDKVDYLNWIIEERTNYYKEIYSHDISWHLLKLKIRDDKLIKEISNMLESLERYPELAIEIIEDTKKRVNSVPEIFRNDISLCEFNINRIKDHAKNETNTNNAIIYLLHVKKEALQYKDLIPLRIGTEIFFDNLEVEIDFYKEKQKIEGTAYIQKSEIVTNQKQVTTEPIRLHWQDDDVLIPYLMKRLFDEGFISNADFDARKDFIEQSFFKKSSKIFTAKEVSSVESNYDLNTNKIPRKAHKVERVINDLISKRDEMSKKSTSKQKKK